MTSSTVQTLTDSTQATRIIGVDVSKDELDLWDSQGQLPRKIPNAADAIRRQLVQPLNQADRTFVVCEATGGYETTLVKALQEAGIAIAVTNPYQVRQFGKGLGLREKTDRIDARLLGRFGQTVALPPSRPKTPAQEHLQALVQRREQLLQLLSQEQNRLAQSRDKQVTRLIGQLLKSLKKQLQTVNEQIKTSLAEEAKVNPAVEVLQSVPGVGIVTAATLVCELPEMGGMNRREIAKLAGVAPLARQSGRSDRPRQVSGGRSQVRRVLYMAALVATRHNPVIKKFYESLLKRGKARKVALVACMRKLLTILNVMVRNRELWRVTAVETEVVAGT